MKTCEICNTKLNNQQKKVCGNDECKRKWHNRYYRKYWQTHPYQADLNRIRSSNRILKVKKIEQYYRDFDSTELLNYNPKQLHYTCPECNHKFNWDFKLLANYKSPSEYYLFSTNTTPWGAPVCPKCALIAYDMYDHPATNDEVKNIIKELKESEKEPIIKKQARYLDVNKTRIDFYEEAHVVRGMLNKRRIKQVNLTEKEKQLCIRAMLANTRNE